jgi:hypothetical protein
MATRSRVALKANSEAKEMTCPYSSEKRTSAAEAVKPRLFAARLKPRPSLDDFFPGLLGSPKAYCAGQIGEFEKSNLDRSVRLVQISFKTSRAKPRGGKAPQLICALSGELPGISPNARSPNRVVSTSHRDAPVENEPGHRWCRVPAESGLVLLPAQPL